MLAVEGSRLARIIVLQNSRHLHAVISHIFSGRPTAHAVTTCMHVLHDVQADCLDMQAKRHTAHAVDRINAQRSPHRSCARASVN